MEGDKKFRLNSIFFTWLISYVSVLFVPLIISGLVYLQSSRVFQKEINNLNEALLKQVQQVMDNRLKSIEGLTRQISQIPGLSSLKNLSNDQNRVGYGQYELYKVIQLLKMITPVDGYIEDIYIYLKETNSVLTRTNYLRADLAFKFLFQYEEITCKDWQTLLNTTHIREYTLARVKQGPGKSNDKIIFLQSLPIESPDNAYGTLVITMNEEYLKEAVQSIEHINKSLVMIIDQNDSVFSSTNGFGPLESPGYNRLKNPSRIIYDYYNGQKVVISHIKSQVNDWQYVCLTPVRIFWEKMAYIKRLAIISFIACLLIGGLVVYLFLKRNYNPINEIIQTLAQKAGFPLGRRYNEYKFIRETMAKVFEEKKRIEEKLESESTEMRSNFLRRLLKGRLGSQISVSDLISSYGMNFTSEYFAVMLFYIEDFSEFLSEKTEMDENERLRLVQFIIISITENFETENILRFSAEMDDQLIACLLNFTQKNNFKQEMYQIASKIQHLMKEKFKIYLTISLSSVYETIDGIHAAYQEAMELMEYKIVVGVNKLITRDLISESNESVYKYYYPLEHEQQIVNCIKAGDYEGAVTILEEIFNNNLNKKTISVSMIKCLMFNIVGTIVKTLNELIELGNDKYLEELRFVERLLACETIPEMKTELLEILQYICQYVKKKQKNYQGFASKIRKFIESNYQNPDLSISMIGEVLGMTPGYISSVFKQETGDGLLWFINKNRIDQAKKLLSKTNRSIGGIAVEVGFINSGAFIRTFKRYEGITPGKYREINALS